MVEREGREGKRGMSGMKEGKKRASSEWGKRGLKEGEEEQ